MQPEYIVRDINVADFPDTRLSIRGIFLHHDNWERYRRKNAATLRPVEVQEAEKLLQCHDAAYGVALLQCPDPNCGVRQRITFGCNSRLCTRCGKPYADRWARALRRTILPLPHRHLTFTVPEAMWPVLKRHRTVALKPLMDAVIGTLDEALGKVIHGAIRKRAGAIVVLHPFGRDLGFKPHVHVICLEGAFEGDRFVHKSYFPMGLFRKTWQYHVLTALREVLPRDDPEVVGLIDRMFREWPQGFYVHVTKETRVEDPDRVIRYVGRYVRHPAIAEARLVGYDGERVSYRWKDHRTGTEKFRTMSVEEFLEALLQHVPERQFKMVRHYGVYARQVKRRYRAGAERWSIAQGKVGDLGVETGPSWRSKGFRCPACGERMEMIAYDPGRGRGEPAHESKLEEWGGQLASVSPA